MDKESSMKNVMAKYKVAQHISSNLILTTGDHYYVILDDLPMTWREMRTIYDNHFIGDSELDVFEKTLSSDSYKNLSKFRLKNGQSILIRNSQIIGMIFDEKAIMANISDFASELEKITSKYNLSDRGIDNYFDLAYFDLDVGW